MVIPIRSMMATILTDTEQIFNRKTIMTVTLIRMGIQIEILNSIVLNWSKKTESKMRI